MMIFKKIILITTCFLAMASTIIAQSSKNQYLFKKKIIKYNDNIHIVLFKGSQLYLPFIKEDSVNIAKLEFCFVEREFRKFPISWDVDNEDRFSFLCIRKHQTGVFTTKRVPIKLIIAYQEKAFRDYMIFRGSTSDVLPLLYLYYAWQRNKSARMHSFFKLHKHLYYSLIVDNPKRYLFYMTKKDSIEEYKWEFKGYWTKTNTLSQPFNSIFQAIRQNDATYIMTDSIIYKVKPDTLLRTGKIIKKPKEKETILSNFFIDDKDTKTFFLFPPYYFIKENEEAPNIKTLKTKKKLYKSAMKLAKFYIKETEE